MGREITIQPVLNGFVCRVGCQSVLFNKPRDLAVAIEEYYTHPEETEKRFLADAVNKMDAVPCPPPAQTDCCNAVESEPRVEGRPRR